MNPSSLRAAMAIFRRIYSGYPEFVRALEERSRLYKDQVEMAERLEEEGKAIIIRPTMQEISRFESKEDELLMSYYHGYTKAKEYIETIESYLSGQRETV